MKAKALIEVLVVFGLTLFLIVIVGRSPAAQWVRETTGRAFLEYGVMIAVPLLILLVLRRNLAEYGISLRNLRYQMNITWAAFIPMAVASAFAGLVDYRIWWGALILSAVNVILLFVLARMLKRKPTMNQGGMIFGGMLLVTLLIPTSWASLSNSVSGLIFYVFFIGLGEELLFRGYIQSRVNAAFGRPFEFNGVCWGTGLVIASGLFGLMHMINSYSLITGSWNPQVWWGLWTFFAGLVLGFVREKTGSIVPTTLLHGLPQGIASAILGT